MFFLLYIKNRARVNRLLQRTRILFKRSDLQYSDIVRVRDEITYSNYTREIRGKEISNGRLRKLDRRFFLTSCVDKRRNATRVEIEFVLFFFRLTRYVQPANFTTTSISKQVKKPYQPRPHFYFNFSSSTRFDRIPHFRSV